MKLTNINEKSMKNENIVPMINCKYCLFSKSFLKSITWIKMKRIVKTNITSPTLNLVIKLETYGRHIKGEVPKLALIDREAPNDIINNESRYIKYLLIFFISIVINNYKTI